MSRIALPGRDTLSLCASRDGHFHTLELGIGIGIGIGLRLGLGLGSGLTFRVNDLGFRV